MRHFSPLPSGFVRSRACLRLFRSRAAFLQDYRLLKLHMEVFGLAITSNRLAVSYQARFVKQLALFCKWANADRVDLLQAALAVYLVRSSISCMQHWPNATTKFTCHFLVQACIVLFLVREGGQLAVCGGDGWSHQWCW